MFSAGRVFFLGILFTFLSICAIGQDLGSSNDLFRSKKTVSAGAKREPVKRKVHLPKRKTWGKTAAFRSNATPVAAPSGLTIEEQFEALLVDGDRGRDKRDYSAAESAYVRAKQLKPNDPRAVYGLGNLYSDQQHWEMAERYYRAAQKLDPANAILNIALSYVLSQPVMVPNLSVRYKEAEDLARRATELAPLNARAFDQLGAAMELGGNISKETEKAFRNAIRLDPSFTPTYAHLGRLLHRQGKLRESEAAYSNSVKLSEDVANMILVADVMLSEQRYFESEPLLRRAVGNDPRNPTGLLLLGKALTALDEFGEAEQILRRSLTVSQNGFMANCLLGTLYTRQGKYESAERALSQAYLAVSPNERRNLSIRFEAVGDGYLKAGRAKDAERVYKQAIALDGKRESLAAKLASMQRK